MSYKFIKNYLLTGLVVWLPVLITIAVLRFIVDLLDSTLALLPKAYRPEQLFGLYIPGLGVLFSLLILIVTGMVTTNFLGQKLVKWGESILSRIPLVRSIYNAVKQIINTILSSNSDAFRTVLLIEYPCKGSWSIAFQTGGATPEMSQKLQEDLVSVYVPTTPNPTSGFLLMLPKKDTVELNMSIDEALKFIISLGVMQSNSLEVFSNHKIN